MRDWGVEEVSAALAQAIEAARRQGPQLIRREGQPVAAIVWYPDFVRLAQADSLVQHFQAASVMGLDLEPARARAVRFEHGRCCVELTDGREIGVPLDRHEFLQGASAEARAAWEIDPGGMVIYWPQLQAWLDVVHLLDVRRQPESGR